MLDVHPPTEKIHGAKDFLLHLLTITIGLFIALALEGCVERWHQRGLRQDAEANLRLELQDNRKALSNGLTVMKDEQKMLTGVLDFLAAKKAGKAFDVSRLQLGFTIVSLSDASWKTAAATGALALMDYAQVERYAAVYGVQEQTMRLEQETLEDFLGMQSYAVYGFDPAKFSVADAVSGEPQVRRALAHLVATEQVAEGVLKGYDSVLEGVNGRPGVGSR